MNDEKCLKLEMPIASNLDMYLILNRAPIDRSEFDRIRDVINLLERSLLGINRTQELADKAKIRRTCKLHPDIPRNAANRCPECQRVHLERARSNRTWNKTLGDGVTQ